MFVRYGQYSNHVIKTLVNSLNFPNFNKDAFNQKSNILQQRDTQKGNDICYTCIREGYSIKIWHIRKKKDPSLYLEEMSLLGSSFFRVFPPQCISQLQLSKEFIPKATITTPSLPVIHHGPGLVNVTCCRRSFHRNIFSQNSRFGRTHLHFNIRVERSDTLRNLMVKKKLITISSCHW